MLIKRRGHLHWQWDDALPSNPPSRAWRNVGQTFVLSASRPYSARSSSSYIIFIFSSCQRKVFFFNLMPGVKEIHSSKSASMFSPNDAEIRRGDFLIWISSGIKYFSILFFFFWNFLLATFFSLFKILNEKNKFQ